MIVRTLTAIGAFILLYGFVELLLENSPKQIIVDQPTQSQPQFQIGDCLVIKSDLNPDMEEWEKEQIEIYLKVDKVGKKKYRTIFHLMSMPATGWAYYDLDYMFANQYTKIECPEIMKNFKMEE